MVTDTFFKAGLPPSDSLEPNANHILLGLANVWFQNFGPEVNEKASIYVPAVGKVTIVVLIRNLLVSIIVSCPFSVLTVEKRIVQNRRILMSDPATIVENPDTAKYARPG